MPTSTSFSPSGSGSRPPAPRRRSTSQRSGRHSAGSRPERRTTCVPSPSAPPRPANVPPIVLAEEDECACVGGDHVSSAARAWRSRTGCGSPLWPGTRTRPPAPTASRRDPLDSLSTRPDPGRRGRRGRRHNGGTGSDTQDDEDDRPAPLAQPGTDQTERVQHRAEQGHAAVRSTSSATTASSPSRRPVSSWRSASGGRRSSSTRSQVPSSRAAGSTSVRSSAVRASPRRAAAARREGYESRSPSAGAGAATQSLDQRGECRRTNDLRGLVGDAHLDRAETRVRAGVPPAARVVLAGRVDVGLPVLRRGEVRRLCATRQLAQPGRAGRERTRSAPWMYGELSERARTSGSHGRSPRASAGRLEALHADVHMEAAHELATELGPAPSAFSGSAAPPRSAAPRPVRTGATPPRRPRGLAHGCLVHLPPQADELVECLRGRLTDWRFVSIRHEELGLQPSGPSSFSTPGASASVRDRRAATPSTPSVSARPKYFPRTA